MPPLMSNSCHLSSLDNETRRTEAATPRCSYIAPSSPSGATHASSCFQRPAPSVLPPSAVSRRCCVAVAPPERSLHVLAIPFALLSHPLPVGPRVSPLVPRDRRGRIGVVPVAYVAAPRHRPPPCAAAAQPDLAPTSFLRAPAGVAARRMPQRCGMYVASTPSDPRSTWAHPRGPDDPIGVPVIVRLCVLPLCRLRSLRLPCPELALMPPPSYLHAAVCCAPVAPAPSPVNARTKTCCELTGKGTGASDEWRRAVLDCRRLSISKHKRSEGVWTTIDADGDRSARQSPRTAPRHVAAQPSSI